MKKWTVVLRRTDKWQLILTEEAPDPADVYVASQVIAPEPMEAVRQAKKEVRFRDRADYRRTYTKEDRADPTLGLREPTKEDYVALAVFAGHHEPVLFGFQAGGQG